MPMGHDRNKRKMITLGRLSTVNETKIITLGRLSTLNETVKFYLYKNGHKNISKISTPSWLNSDRLFEFINILYKLFLKPNLILVKLSTCRNDISETRKKISRNFRKKYVRRSFKSKICFTT